jgi:hypothetical protein
MGDEPVEDAAAEDSLGVLEIPAAGGRTRWTQFNKATRAINSSLRALFGGVPQQLQLNSGLRRAVRLADCQKRLVGQTERLAALKVHSDAYDKVLEAIENDASLGPRMPQFQVPSQLPLPSAPSQLQNSARLTSIGFAQDLQARAERFKVQVAKQTGEETAELEEQLEIVNLQVNVLTRQVAGTESDLANERTASQAHEQTIQTKRSEGGKTWAEQGEDSLDALQDLMVEIKVAQDKLQTSRLRVREHEDELKEQKKDLAKLKVDQKAIVEKLKSKKPAAQAGGGPAKKTKPNDGDGGGEYDCEYDGCEYHGSFSAVSEHEDTCKHRSSSGSAATNARMLVQAFFVTNVIHGNGNIGSFAATGAVGKGKGKGKK